MRITISKENYLKAILEAEAEGEPVIGATLARWLKVSSPAVTMAIRRLKQDGLLTVDPGGQLHLTAAGREIASRLLKRHQLIERMLTEVFGMEWYKVHDEAEHLEHAVSQDFERLLVRKLGQAACCPHGNQLGPESHQDRRRRGWKPLAEARPGEPGQVASVFERDRQLLEYLDGLGMRPGAEIEVTARNADETLSIQVGGNTVQLGQAAARRIWMAPRDPAGRA